MTINVQSAREDRRKHEKNTMGTTNEHKTKKDKTNIVENDRNKKNEISERTVANKPPTIESVMIFWEYTKMTERRKLEE